MTCATTHRGRFNFRKHPVLMVFAFIFFAVSLAIIAAVYMSAPASSTSKRPKRGVDRLRIPAEGSDDRPAVTDPILAMMSDAPGAEAAQASTEDAPASRWRAWLINTVLIIIGVTIAVTITSFITQTPFFR